MDHRGHPDGSRSSEGISWTDCDRYIKSGLGVVSVHTSGRQLLAYKIRCRKTIL